MEIETKAKVEDLSEIKKKLIDLGAEFFYTEQQDDSYYKPKGKEMADQGPGDFITRIREGKKNQLAIKELTNRAGVWHEYETDISNVEQAKKILEKLGLVNIFDVNKKREHGKLDGMSLCLDDIKQLGKYLEVEVIGEDGEDGKKRIDSLFKKLGIKQSQVEHKGYARIIHERMGVRIRGVE
ncbi:class IV adenylate cyclase [Candidatus Woesearchaeota archaeon]|nr:class IV adenylate cyclase [Candidatus Woesearchaeota archaeon]